MFVHGGEKVQNILNHIFCQARAPAGLSLALFQIIQPLDPTGIVNFRALYQPVLSAI